MIAWWRRLGLDLLEGYALTENFAYSHMSPPGQVRPGFVGPPLPGVECRLVDGEVEVRGPGMMLGYYRDEVETAGSFTADGFLKTGDLGLVDTDGQLRITGRRKELFKTDKGKYIAPAPIENLIVDHPAVEQCCVTGARHAQPYALVVLSDAARRSIEDGGERQLELQLAAHLAAINQGLPGYAQLSFLAVVHDAWLPENGFLTPTLKVKRARIDAAYEPLERGWYDERKAVVWQRHAAASAWRGLPARA